MKDYYGRPIKIGDKVRAMAVNPTRGVHGGMCYDKFEVVGIKHYHDQHRATARCFIGERIGFEDCLDAQGQPARPPENGGEQPGLELHHAHVEFSLQNGVSLKALEHDYPGISNPDEVGKWVESGDNFRGLCAWHHRGAAGAHSASHSDWEASRYVIGLITKDESKPQ